MAVQNLWLTKVHEDQARQASKQPLELAVNVCTWPTGFPDFPCSASRSGLPRELPLPRLGLITTTRPSQEPRLPARLKPDLERGHE